MRITTAVVNRTAEVDIVAPIVDIDTRVTIADLIIDWGLG
jgi:hypothetical protein